MRLVDRNIPLDANGQPGRPRLEDDTLGDGREVIVFPGRDGVVDPRRPEAERGQGERSVSALLKLIGRCCVSTTGEPVGVSCVEYETAPEDSVILHGYLMPDGYCSAEAMQFVDAHLLPRLPRLLRDDARPDVATLQERMGKLTFVSHSYGAMFAQQVCNGLRQRLDERHYPAPEIAAVCRAGVLVSTAGASLLRSDAPQFTAVHFRAATDDFIKTALNERALQLLKMETGQAHVAGGIAHQERTKQLYRDTGYEMKRQGMQARRATTVAQVLAPLSDSTEYYEGAELRVADRAHLGNMAVHSPASHYQRDAVVGPKEFNNCAYVEQKEATLCRAINRPPGIANAETLLGENLVMSGFYAAKAGVRESQTSQGR